MIEAHLRAIVSLGDITNFCCLLVAPVFIMVSGVSFQFFISSRRERGYSERKLFFEGASRAIVLFFLTLIPPILSKLLFHPSDFASDPVASAANTWSIFQVIAVGYGIGILFTRNILIQILSIPAIIFLSGMMSSMNIFGLLTSGFYPLFPYFAYFLIGQLLTKLYTDTRLRRVHTITLFTCSIVLFFGLLMLTFISHLSLVLTNYKQNQTEPIIIALIASILLIILIFLIRVIDKRERAPILLRPIERVGRISFTSYYLEDYGATSVSLILLTSIGLSSIPIIVNPILLVIFILGLALFEWQWKRINYFLGAEWFLRKGSALLMRVGRAIGKIRLVRNGD